MLILTNFQLSTPLFTFQNSCGFSVQPNQGITPYGERAGWHDIICLRVFKMFIIFFGLTKKSFETINTAISYTQKDIYILVQNIEHGFGWTKSFKTITLLFHKSVKDFESFSKVLLLPITQKNISLSSWK